MGSLLQNQSILGFNVCILLATYGTQLIDGGLLGLDLTLNSLLTLAKFVDFFYIIISKHREFLDLFAILIFVVSCVLQDASLGVSKLFESSSYLA